MNKEYSQSIASLKAHVRLSQQQAVLSVNTHLLFLYWEIGHFINRQRKHQGWGAEVIKQVSNDLTAEFPEIKGFSQRNLIYMAKFAETHSIQNTQPPVAQIENKSKKTSKDKETAITQPPIAQINSPLDWTGFANTQVAKIS